MITYKVPARLVREPGIIKAYVNAYDPQVAIHVHENMIPPNVQKHLTTDFVEILVEAEVNLNADTEHNVVINVTKMLETEQLG